MNQIKFLTAKQTSEYLQIPLRTIQHMSKEGKIKAVKIGKKWKYRKSDIELYIFYGTNFSKEPTRKPDSFVEKRDYPRINTDLDCRYLINLPRFKVINNKGIIKNLSAGGALSICQDDEININDPIDLNFMNINVKGRVVRKNKNELGIKFRYMDEEIKSQIIQYVG